MAFNKYKKKGLTGLVNLGNTCFMNSTLQALSHTYELHDILKNDWNFKKNIKTDNDLLTNEYNELLKTIWTSNGKVVPNRFLHFLYKVAINKDKEIFTGYSQNDMPEFLLFLFDCIHQSLSREVSVNIKGSVQHNVDKIAKKCYEYKKQTYEKEYSEIYDKFFGLTVSQVTSLKGKLYSIKPEYYNILDLPIHEKCNTLYDCFDFFITPECLNKENDNQYYYENENAYVDANKQMIFWDFPQVLIISLKRYENRNNKKNQMIHFPLDGLDLSKYVCGYKASSYVYDLYSIINHSGHATGGHYTTYVRNADNKWYHFNDDEVTSINSNRLISPLAYVLFYRKK